MRTVEFPPVKSYSHARVYAPGVKVAVYANLPGERRRVAFIDMPAANWQDDQPLSIACTETLSDSYRIEISNAHEMTLPYVHFYSAARQQNWESEAAWTLRRIVREEYPQQDPRSRVDPSAIVDISAHMDSSGKLNWTAPAGNWTVLRIGHVNTGQKNGPAPPEATGWEATKLHPSGIRANFDGYIGRLIKGDGALKDGLLQGVLLDSWECKTQTWTAGLDRIFDNQWSYPLRSMFPALFGYVVDNPENTARFLRDWRVTLNDLLVENFFGEMSRLADENGLTVSFETASGDVFPGDILEYYKHADVPMCEFWQPRSDSFVGSIEFKPVLTAENIVPDIIAHSPDLRWLHRQIGETGIYFLSTFPEKGYRGVASFRVRGNVELWDPLSGETVAVNSSVKDNYTEVELDIPAGSSCFLVFGNKKSDKPLRQTQPTEKMDLSGTPWQIYFPGGWGVENSPVVTPKLVA